MGEEVIWNVGALMAEVVDRAAEIEGVSEDDSGGDQVQPRGTMPLVLEGAVAQLAQTVEEDCPSKSVACLALVQVGARSPAQLRVVQPVEHEEGALDSADFAKGSRHRVLARVAGQLWGPVAAEPKLHFRAILSQKHLDPAERAVPE